MSFHYLPSQAHFMTQMALYASVQTSIYEQQQVDLYAIDDLVHTSQCATSNLGIEWPIQQNQAYMACLPDSLYYSDAPSSNLTCSDESVVTPSPNPSSDWNSSPLPPASILPSQHSPVVDGYNDAIGVTLSDIEGVRLDHVDASIKKYDDHHIDTCQGFVKHEESLKQEYPIKHEVEIKYNFDQAPSVDYACSREHQQITSSSQRDSRSARYSRVSRMNCSSNARTRRNVNKPIPNYVCSYMSCSRTFSRKEHLERHYKTHSGEKPERCPYNQIHPRLATSCPDKSRHDNAVDHLKAHLRAYVIATQPGLAKHTKKTTKSKPMTVAEIKRGLISIHGPGVQQAHMIDQVLLGIKQRMDKEFAKDHLGFDESLWSVAEHLSYPHTATTRSPARSSKACFLSKL